MAQRDPALAEQEAQLSAQAERHEEAAGLAIAIEEGVLRPRSKGVG
ncbi:MAG: hypothetical protein IPL99_12915 [Candidatus Competibacteraceae bacterium]|nr:hypothetical protein [Candidatus Competibacteraceae bacterium]